MTAPKTNPAVNLQLLALLAAILVAAMAMTACANNSTSIPRAKHENLPTPNRGYFYPTEDELDANGGASSDNFGEFEGAGFSPQPGDTITPEDLAANPELAQLFSKVDAGNATDADYQRIDSILFGIAGGQFGGGTPAAQVIFGTIAVITGNDLTIAPFTDTDSGAADADNDQDESDADETEDAGESQTATPEPTPEPINVTINKDTHFLAVSTLNTADIQPGEEISAIAERNDEGRIRARRLSIIDIEDDSAFALATDTSPAPPGFSPPPFGRGRPGPAGGFTTEGETTIIIEVHDIESLPIASQTIVGANIAGIPASGRVTKVEGDRLHVEAAQGPLRITVDDESIAARAQTGRQSDLKTGIAVAITATDDGTALTLAYGPTTLFNINESDRFPWLTP